MISIFWGTPLFDIGKNRRVKIFFYSCNLNLIGCLRRGAIDLPQGGKLLESRVYINCEVIYSKLETEILIDRNR
jgi:hypothetical protein